MAEPDLRIGTTTTAYELAAPLSLPAGDRLRHLHCVGATGAGKSTFLLNAMLQDLSSCRGFALIDPAGDLAKDLANEVSPERTNDVLFWDVSDPTHAVGFNPVARMPPAQRPLAAAHIVSAFSRIWGTTLATAPRLPYVLLNCVRLLLDNPGSTLVMVPRLLVDDEFRASLLRATADPFVRNFWEREFPAYGDRLTSEVIGPVQTRVGYLLSDPTLRCILGQRRPTINLPALMDEGRVLLVNLARGRIGEAPAYLLGALLSASLAQAAESRLSKPEHQRRDFYLYADEFHNFVTPETFGWFYSEARKSRLGVVTANQSLAAQLPDTLRQALLSNVGSLLAFRVSPDDADVLAPKLGLTNSLALAETPNFRAWGRLLINGHPTDPKLIRMHPPDIKHSHRAAVVAARSRARHTRLRTDIERDIAVQIGLHRHTNFPQGHP